MRRPGRTTRRNGERGAGPMSRVMSPSQPRRRLTQIEPEDRSVIVGEPTPPHNRWFDEVARIAGDAS